MSLLCPKTRKKNPLVYLSSMQVDNPVLLDAFCQVYNREEFSVHAIILVGVVFEPKYIFHSTYVMVFFIASVKSSQISLGVNSVYMNSVPMSIS